MQGNMNNNRHNGINLPNTNLDKVVNFYAFG